MLLQALVDYYELLEKENKAVKIGFGKENVSYALDINKDGRLLAVINLKEEGKGKKLKPVAMTVPERVGRASAVSPNFLCDNSSYVLGFDKKGKPERTKECFYSFKKLHKVILKNVDHIEAQAVISFLDKWDTETAMEHELFQEHLEDILKGGNFVFRYDRKNLIHENEDIKKAWIEYKNNCDEKDKNQCLVTGKRTEIARLHPIIKGIYKGQAMGNQLVSFNAEAYESYGKKQGQNAPTGEYAVFAYGTALNALLADERHRMVLGDTTVVFWAETVSTQTIQNMNQLLSGNGDAQQGEMNRIKDEITVNEIGAILKKISKGKQILYDEPIFQDDTKVYIAGLSPNAARISVRFFIQDSFGQLSKKVLKHYQDMAIQKKFIKDMDSIPIWRIISETVPSNSKDKNPSPLLAGSIFRAILTGREYPANLYQTILNRINAEHDVTHVKAAVIKAYLTRKYENNDSVREVLTMGLNKESCNKGYLLGRLFATLEKVQRDANPGLKSTIAEKYLSSACATPAKIFPFLLNLSNNHMAKLDYGIKYKKLIAEILDKIEPENVFPSNFTPDQQGNFYLGYYHQNNENFKKKEVEEYA